MSNPSFRGGTATKIYEESFSNCTHSRVVTWKKGSRIMFTSVQEYECLFLELQINESRNTNTKSDKDE